MRFKMKRLSLATMRVLGAGIAGALLAQPALSQQPPRERIEVTGSNIKRVEGEGPSAIIVMTREEIERSGATNAFELMNFVASNNSAGNVSFASTIGALTFSANTASLRGLQGGRTLVLLNGKRLNSFSGEIQGVSGVNLTTIPFNAIERVEVLLDGASAIYGSDAVAGVINFIVRKDYRGAEATVYYGAPTRGGGGGEQTTYKASLGFGDLAKDRYNVFVAAQYDKQEALEQRVRNFSNTSVRLDTGLVGISGTTFPAFVTTGDIGNPGFPDCAPSRYFPDLGERCFYDPAEQVGVMSIPDLETKNVYAAANFHFGANLQGYLSGNFMTSKNNFVIQPVPIADIFGDTITLPADSPFYPTAAAIAAGVNGQPLNVRWRAVEKGNRDTSVPNEQGQIVAGLKGSAWNWDWDASATFNEGTTEQALNGGFPLRSLIVPLLNSGRVNMFGPNTPAISDEVRATNFTGKVFDGTAKSTYLDAKVSGEVMSLPSGPLAMAFGVQAGAQEFTQTPAPVLATGDLSGFGGNVLPVDRDRDTYAVFAEMNIPITRALEANLAVRHDDYSDFGSTTNPKVSFRYTPVDMLLLRGSYNQGFAAPTLYSMFLPNSTTFTGNRYNDPVLCPGGTVAAGGIATRDCGIQFQQMQGGNPDLQPEESEAWTIGFVLQVTPELSFGIDYWNYYIEDSISTVGEQSIFADPVKYSNLFVRCSAADPARRAAIGACQIPGGDPLAYILNTFQNLGDTETYGIDINLVWNGAATQWGRFSAAARGTYIMKYEFQVEPDSTWYNPVGNYNPQFGGPVLRYQQITTFNWAYQDWTATLSNQFQSGYLDQNAAGSIYIPAYRQHSVGKSSLWNLGVTWSGYKGLTLAAGVLNIFDEDPEFSNQSGRFQARGYDDRFGSPLGRIWTVGARYSFL